MPAADLGALARIWLVVELPVLGLVSSPSKAMVMRLTSMLLRCGVVGFSVDLARTWKRRWWGVGRARWRSDGPVGLACGAARAEGISGWDAAAQADG